MPACRICSTPPNTQRARAADNLTLIAMRWGAPDPDTATRDMSLAVPAERALPPISDEEIELAVAEIRRRIPFDPNGASS